MESARFRAYKCANDKEPLLAHSAIRGMFALRRLYEADYKDQHGCDLADFGLLVERVTVQLCVLARPSLLRGTVLPANLILRWLCPDAIGHLLRLEAKAEPQPAWRKDIGIELKEMAELLSHQKGRLLLWEAKSTLGKSTGLPLKFFMLLMVVLMNVDNAQYSREMLTKIKSWLWNPREDVKASSVQMVDCIQKRWPKSLGGDLLGNSISIDLIFVKIAQLYSKQANALLLLGSPAEKRQIHLPSAVRQCELRQHPPKGASKNGDVSLDAVLKHVCSEGVLFQQLVRGILCITASNTSFLH